MQVLPLGKQSERSHNLQGRNLERNLLSEGLRCTGLPSPWVLLGFKCLFSPNLQQNGHNKAQLCFREGLGMGEGGTASPWPAESPWHPNLTGALPLLPYTLGSVQMHRSGTSFTARK